MADLQTIVFIRISTPDSPDGRREDVKVHTGLGTPYPETSKWFDYTGTGALLSISPVEGGVETAAGEYELSLKIPDEAASDVRVRNFYADVRRTDMQNAPVEIHSVSWSEADVDDLPEPTRIFTGRVNSVALRPQGIVCRIYTPATLLNKVVGAVARLNPLEHQRYIDADDKALRFITDTTRQDVYFP